MTQSSLQTQCPNCQTRFRVTGEQLGIANGKVRCGNCMKVFKAADSEAAEEQFGEPANESRGEGALQDDEPEAFDIDPPFRDLRRDPVHVASRKSRLSTVLWALIALGLFGLLIAQISWFQFDRLAAIPELRPFYEQGCELVGCELDPLINVDAIQTRKLVVRTDPDNRSELVVDAIIINRASFKQPFPAIALTFSNLNGDVVAQSLFTPEEYLAGEGRELDAMATDTAVRIAINIRDPGRDAVNYNLLFRPHTP